MIRILARALNVVHIALVYFAELLLTIMVVLIFTNVVLRYLFNSGILWSDEVALLVAVWFSFIAMALGVKLRLHIHINVLSASRIPAVVNTILWKLRDIVVILVGAGMMVWGRILIRFTMNSVLPATGLPAGTLYAIVPVASAVIVVDGLMQLFGADTESRLMEEHLAGKRSFLSVLRSNGNEAGGRDA